MKSQYFSHPRRIIALVAVLSLFTSVFAGAPSAMAAAHSSTYTVTYNGNANTGGSPPTDTTAYSNGATVTVAGPNTLVKTGYTFGGWTTGGGAGPVVTYSQGGTFTINANTTLTAIWNLVSTYTVTYLRTGSDSGTPPLDSNSPYGSGSTVTVLGRNTLVKAGYTFGGWIDFDTQSY